MRPRMVGVVAVSLLALLGGITALAQDEEGTVASTTGTTTTTRPTTTVSVPAPTTTTAPPPTTALPAPTVPPVAPPPVPSPPVPDVSPFTGLGTWVDVYDWTEAKHPEAATRVTAADVDRMAAVGVQTLYIQTAHYDLPGEVAEIDRLLPILRRAEQRGVEVVVWYLPAHEDEALDLARLLAASRLPGVDAVAVDIESERLPDVPLRSARLVTLSRTLRERLPATMAIGAIPYPPVVTDVLNGRIWPGFPWLEVAPYYDVWLPMAYQTFRSAATPWRDGYGSASENVDRLRGNLGRTDVPVHVIGGIADRTTAEDAAGIIRAADDRALIGASLYDWDTTPDALWPIMRAARDPNR